MHLLGRCSKDDTFPPPRRVQSYRHGLPVHCQVIMLLNEVVIIQPNFLTLKINSELFFHVEKIEVEADSKLELESRKQDDIEEEK